VTAISAPVRAASSLFVGPFHRGLASLVSASVRGLESAESLVPALHYVQTSWMATAFALGLVRCLDCCEARMHARKIFSSLTSGSLVFGRRCKRRTCIVRSKATTRLISLRAFNSEIFILSVQHACERLTESPGGWAGHPNQRGSLRNELHLWRYDAALLKRYVMLSNQGQLLILYILLYAI